MKSRQNKGKVKSIVMIMMAIILLLLLIFSEDIIKMQNKNKIALSESSSFETMPNEPNLPRVSAGMMPVKWDGSYWVITTKDDPEWYDYSSGKFAHVMLNDGKYQSELIRDMTNKKLADENVGVGVPDDPNIRGTIFIWIPRFAYKESGEIKYAPSEMQPGGEWKIPEMFSYMQTDETKPDFSLSGVWVQKDVDTGYASKITEMQKEDGIYGFLAHTKSIQITSNDIKPLQTYVGAGLASAHPILDITNTNRIILKIVDTTKYEPIKANVTHNAVDKKLEIRVTYSKNGISKILDENKNELTLSKIDGIIYADTGDKGLAKGIYYFTIIDNNENKKELSIDVVVDGIFKVAYIKGTDNMNIDTAYAKTQETKTTEETALLNEISVIDTTTTYSRAIKDSNNAVTAIGEENRRDEDEVIYVYSKYTVNSNTTYSWVRSSIQKNSVREATAYGYPSVITNSATGVVKTSGSYGSYVNNNGRYNVSGNNYYVYSKGTEFGKLDKTTYARQSNTTYSRGTFITYVSGEETTYPTNGRNDDSYWYVRGDIMKKYKLYKYDENLILKSTYNVDTKEITTEPINISNKGSNKVKLTLNASGSDYKTYISNDNATWKEVIDITSGTAKELDVDGWDKLYIKIETNTSRIDDIDIAYYKD